MDPDNTAEVVTPDALRATAERLEREVEHMTGWGGEPDLGAALAKAARCTRLVADMMEPSEAMLDAVGRAIDSSGWCGWGRETAGPTRQRELAREKARAALKAATQAGGGE